MGIVAYIASTAWFRGWTRLAAGVVVGLAIGMVFGAAIAFLTRIDYDGKE